MLSILCPSNNRERNHSYFIRFFFSKKLISNFLFVINRKKFIFSVTILDFFLFTNLSFRMKKNKKLKNKWWCSLTRFIIRFNIKTQEKQIMISCLNCLLLFFKRRKWYIYRYIDMKERNDQIEETKPLFLNIYKKAGIQC